MNERIENLRDHNNSGSSSSNHIAGDSSEFYDRTD